MTDTPIDPAATPDDEDAPEIAADDVGASGLAERAAKHARHDPEQDAGGGMEGEGSTPTEPGGASRSGMAGEGA